MRNAILLLLIIGITATCQAQTMAGFKAGVNYSLYNTSEEEKNGPLSRGHEGSLTGIGWHVGGYFQYNFAEHIGLRAELLWSARNMSHDLSWTYNYVDPDDTTTTFSYGLTGTYKETRSYLELPVLFAMQFGAHFTLHVGPGIGLLMAAKHSQDGTFSTHLVTTLTDTTFEAPSSYDVSGKDGKQGQSNVDISACLGAVYELDGGLAFGVRGWYGFGTLEDPVDWTSTKGMVLQASVGWNFIDNRRSRRRR